MNIPLPISLAYRKPIFEALVLQGIVAVLSLMILDGGTTARICGIALLGFWGGTAVLILRRPIAPTTFDLAFVRFGYLPVVLLAILLVHFVWPAGIVL